MAKMPSLFDYEEAVLKGEEDYDISEEYTDLWIHKCAIPFALDWLSKHDISELLPSFKDYWTNQTIPMESYWYPTYSKVFSQEEKEKFVHPEEEPWNFVVCLIRIIEEFMEEGSDVLGNLSEIRHAMANMAIDAYPIDVETAHACPDFYKVFDKQILTACLFYKFLGCNVLQDVLHFYYSSLYKVTYKDDKYCKRKITEPELVNEVEVIYKARYNSWAKYRSRLCC